MNDLTRKRTRRPAARKDEALAPEAAPAAAGVQAHDEGAVPESDLSPISAAVTGALAVIAHSAAATAQGEAAPSPAPATASKVTLVRASFSLAKEDHATLADLKRSLRAAGVDAKKSQLLRVAVGLLRDTEPARLQQLVAALAPARKRK